MAKIPITQEQFNTAKAQAAVAALGIRAMGDRELVMHLLELYLKGLKAGIVSAESRINLAELN